MLTEQSFTRPRAPGARILAVAAPYYREVTGRIMSGAQKAIAAAGAEMDIVEVPGAFEIPQAIAHHAAARPGSYEGYLALGCVVRGETSHYDYVCVESARALMELGVANGLAIGFGILTVENLDQAIARSTPERNKGEEAAIACLSMVALKRSLSGDGR